MLPIADAFATAEGSNHVLIHDVSGTSAGAICAALVAQRANFTAVRNYIITAGPAHFAKLVPAPVGALRARLAKDKRLGLLTLLRHWKLAYGVGISGYPLLASDELRDFVKGVLAAGGRDPGAWPAKLHVTASDIVKSVGVTHASGDLTGAVVDSCSLPILLRSFDSLRTSHLVDGGLCDNLPVECLIGEHQDSIFAVYPRSDAAPAAVDNVFSYVSALLSASIGHSVRRSVAMVGKPFQFEADTDLGLLDFSAAIALLANDDWYDAEKTRALKRIKSFSRTYGNASSPHEARVVDVVSIKQYTSLLARLPDSDGEFMTCRSAKFVVKINAADRYASVDAIGTRKEDTLTSLIDFVIVKEAPRFYKTYVPLDRDSIIPTVWSVRNLTTDREMPILAYPLDPTMRGGNPARECLIEFMEPERWMSVGDIIQLQSVRHTAPAGDMRMLNVGRTDSICYTNNRDDVVDNIDIVLVYPRTLGKIMLHAGTADGQEAPVSASPIASNMDQRVYAGTDHDVVGYRFHAVPAGGKICVNACPT